MKEGEGKGKEKVGQKEEVQARITVQVLLMRLQVFLCLGITIAVGNELDLEKSVQGVGPVLFLIAAGQKYISMVFA